MNQGVFPNQYGARLAPIRINFRTSAGSTQYFGEAIVLATTDMTGPTNTSRGSGAPIANVPHFVLQLPYSVGRCYQNNTATAAFCFQIPDGRITGGNPRGFGSIDLQTSRTAATQVASGINAVVLGRNCTASGSGAVAVGDNNTAAGNFSFVAGEQSSASASGGIAIGSLCVANGGNATAFGLRGNARGLSFTHNFGGGFRANTGDRQVRLIPQSAVTTNATTTTLTANGAAEGTTNTWVLPNNYTVAAEAMVIARNTANNDSIVWKVTNIVASRDASAATVALLGSPTVTVMGTADASMTTCTLVVNTNTTNGSVRLQFTGLAATTIAVSGWLLPCVENG